MSFSIEKHPHKPIIINTVKPDYNMAQDLVPSNEQVRAILDVATEKLYYIIVFQQTLTLDEIMIGANRVARGENSLWHHPNVKQVILVTDSDALRLSARGMASQTFGNLTVPVFGTLEEAFAYTGA